MKRCRLIYRSIANDGILEPGALEESVARFAENNEKAGISGLLLLSDDRFLQVLEGPTKFVNEVFRKIMADPRHREVELVTYEELSDSFFYDWNMKVLRMDESMPEKLRETLTRKYSNRVDVIPIPNELILVHALLVDARWGLLEETG